MSARRTADLTQQAAIGAVGFWFALPSWLVSAAFHAALLFVLALTIQRPAAIGNPDADEREIGIYSKEAHDGPVGGSEGDAGEPAESSDSTTNAAADTHHVETAPPIDLELPATVSTRIGPGAGAPVESSPDSQQMVRSSGKTLGDGGGAGGGGGGIPFFGHKAEGGRFVYVVDASGSMYDYNAIAVAKAELLASLEQLDSTQQFQIIFYNEKYFPMTAPGGKDQLFWGTDTSRTLASQFIRGVQPDGGTRHLDALLAALTYGPDVIFFLTDAGPPELYAADLDKIKKRNNGRAKIFTIEFGKGAKLRVPGFLEKLSAQNGGGYGYRDVTQFRKQ